MDLQTFFGANLQSFSLLYYALLLMVHLAFAAGVARDAGEVSRHRGGTLLVGPYVWVFATLVGGVFVGIGYWVLHHLLAPYQRGIGAMTNPEERRSPNR